MSTINTLSFNPATVKQWVPPGDMFRQFIVRAAINSFAARNPTLYSTVFMGTVQSLGSVDAVKRLQVPEPWVFTEACKQQDQLLEGLDFNLDTSEVLRGLYLFEYFMENPQDKINFTPAAYSVVARRIAGL